MRFNREQAAVRIAIVVFIAIVSLPFLSARPANPDLRFGGFLVNPIDGHSYLAKMRQGYDGAWTFTLPYSANPGDEAAINLYYLFLGHMSRLLRLPALVVFHVARVAGALLLALALLRLFSRVLPTTRQCVAAFGLALFGSGLGWLAFSVGVFTGDFWVAEAFPFLGSLTNAHFPLGMALQVWLLTPNVSARFIKLAPQAIAAALLSVVYPFGWAITVFILIGWASSLFFWRASWRVQALQATAVLAGGLPYAIYALVVINIHPALAEWNLQNQTLVLTPFDLLISLAPAALFAIGVILTFRQLTGLSRFLALWLVLGVLVLYVPVNLQRRLMSGLYIPAAALAVWFIANKVSAKRRSLAFLAVLALSLPTNLLVVVGGMQAVQRGDDALVVSHAELAAYAWLDEHASGALVLASPETGLRLPAYSSVRVVYGHPFETVNAEENEAAVSTFFSEGDHSLLEVADFIFYGPREATFGFVSPPPDWEKVYDSANVEIWSKVP